MSDVRPRNRFQQVERAENIILVIAQRLLNGLANRFQAREVHHGLEAAFVDNGLQGGCIHQVELFDLERGFGQLLNPLQRLGAAVRIIINHCYIMARAQQFKACMRADIASAASYKDFDRDSPSFVDAPAL